MSTGPYTPIYPVAGAVTAVDWAQTVVDGVNYMQGTPITGADQRPYAVLVQTVLQSIPNSATTAILFDTEALDTANGHSSSTNTSRWTCPTGKHGWYQVSACAAFASNSTGDRAAWLQVNGTTRYNGDLRTAASGHQTSVCLSDLIYLNDGDYLELIVDQYSGGSLNTDKTFAGGCRMSLTQERMQ